MATVMRNTSRVASHGTRAALLGAVIAVCLAGAPPTLAHFSDDSRLEVGTARTAALLSRYVDDLRPNARQGLEAQPNGHPAYAGTAVVAARSGVIVSSFAVGFGLRYENATTALPREHWISARTSTIWDLASLTKTFTALAVTKLLAKGHLRLDAPANNYLPRFGQGGKDGITIRMLLTHTSGLPADPVPGLWDPIYADNSQRWSAIMATAPIAAPGAQYLYSDVNYLVLQRVIEKVAGHGLAWVIREWITKPLGMTDTMFNPPKRLRSRIAATEYQEPSADLAMAAYPGSGPMPARGMVWGSADDDNAWALGGVAGHAGLFSTTRDIAIFSQMILNRGTYDGIRIVPRSWATGFFRNYNRAYPGNGHSLIMQINQYPDYFGALDTMRTIGHTGFTGTSVVINPRERSFVVMLANRIHPNRQWSPNNNLQRRAVADDVARAVAVRPMEGTYSWFSGMTSNLTDAQVAPPPSSITFPITDRGSAGARLRFNLWFQLIPAQAGPPAESGALLSSVDGGLTWQPLAFSVRMKRQSRAFPDGTFTGLDLIGWGKARADLPPTTSGGGV